MVGDRGDPVDHGEAAVGEVALGQERRGRLEAPGGDAVKRIPPVATPVTVPSRGVSSGPKASASPPIVAVPTTPGPTKFGPPSSDDQK